MAAAVTVTPTEVQVGDKVVIVGTGFLPNVECQITIPEHGFIAEVVSDASGTVSSESIAAKAVGTLTSDATVPTAADTVVVGSVTYTFRAAVTTTANEVKLGSGGAAAADSLANLKAAINADPAGSGVTYGSLTVVNPTVGAGALTATTLQMYAKTGGTAGNSLTSTEGSTHLSYGASTLLGGLAATGVDDADFYPPNNYPFTAKVSDGTSTASANVKVFTQ